MVMAAEAVTQELLLRRKNMQVSQFFEALMLLCFGLAWPLSILKMWRSKRADGKSVWFLCIILLGYSSGIAYKITGNIDKVIFLYGLNLVLVSTDLVLCLTYQRRASSRSWFAPTASE